MYRYLLKKKNQSRYICIERINIYLFYKPIHIYIGMCVCWCIVKYFACRQRKRYCDSIAYSRRTYFWIEILYGTGSLKTLVVFAYSIEYHQHQIGTILLRYCILYVQCNSLFSRTVTYFDPGAFRCCHGPHLENKMIITYRFKNYGHIGILVLCRRTKYID